MFAGSRAAASDHTWSAAPTRRCVQRRSTPVGARNAAPSATAQQRAISRWSHLGLVQLKRCFLVTLGLHQFTVPRQVLLRLFHFAQAPINLRELRIGQLSIYDVPAAVLENLNVSLLGMSFLGRLQGYEMRDGKLTVSW